jgi:hypothetical protein
MSFYETSTGNMYLAHYKVSKGSMTPPRLRDNNKKYGSESEATETLTDLNTSLSSKCA